MKIFNMNLKLVTLTGVAMLVGFSFFGSTAALAAATPSLGTAASFSVLANTFTSTTIPNGASMFGDAGYTTFPGVSVYVSGSTHVNDATYTQAGTDQHSALVTLNSQTCDFTFPAGPVDLATDTSHITYGGALGVYPPGVYCSSGTMSIGGGKTITFDGTGTYIFRPSGMITTSDFSIATTTNGASACDIFWTPQIPSPASTVLGSDTRFVGTVIEPLGPVNADITVGGGTRWVGRALAFNWNVTTNPVIMKYVTITAPTCLVPPPPTTTTATLHVIKHVINDDGSKEIASDFILHVKGSGGMGSSEVTGSPAPGVESPGTSYSLTAGTYTVSEDTHSGYTPSFSGDCDSHGNITLTSGGSGTCIITNDDIAVPHSATSTLHVIKHVINDGSKEIASDFILHVKGTGGMGSSEVVGSPAPGVESPGNSYSLTAGTYTVSEDVHTGYTSSFSGDCDSHGSVTLVAGDSKICTITNNDIAIPPVSSHPATLHIIKVVVNDDGGKAVVSDAIVHVMNGVGDVAGSPAAGTSSPGKAYTIEAGTYSVSEDFFPGYTVKISGDCSDSGIVKLAEGDDKTCIITNNDIAGIVVPPVIVVTTSTPPVIATSTCNICQLLTYDIYIINPDGSERHTGTPWVKVTDRGNGIKRYSFEDATLDPNNILFDHNDSIVDIDFKDCQSVKFMFVSSDASWKHQVRIKVSIDGVAQSDTLVAVDSKSVVGTSKTVNATTGVNTKTACAKVTPAVASLKGKILLQVQAHGEAWYIYPKNGLRYYMANGEKAYEAMRNFGVGITNSNLAKIKASKTLAKKSSGKIFLQVQSHGEAYYIDFSGVAHYLKDGAAAYEIMRSLGLGITNINLNKITIGSN